MEVEDTINISDMDGDEEFLEEEILEEVVDQESNQFMKPTVGMIFESSEDMFEYWKDYGKHMGFPVRKRSSKKGANGEYKNLCYSCAREGKPSNSSSNPLKPRPSTRTGCQVRLIALLDEDGKWRVSKLLLDHNHELSPTKAHLFRCNRRIPLSARRRLDLNDRTGIRMNKSFDTFVVEEGGYENVKFTEKDARNRVDKQRNLRLGEGDAVALMNYFQKMSSKNPGFYHSIDVDKKDGRLKNVFWADSRSREAYKEFGDVVTFDTTYLTNKYEMPFAPFVGVNHHGQTILFGCGLISAEDVPTFTWLFRAWLGCMSEHAPHGIITDQDKAMQKAVEIVFPRTRHRWCLWHIMKKLPEKLSGYKEADTFIPQLASAVYDSQTTEEFEQLWTNVIDNYSLHKNDWLCTMYAERRRWIPCFVKDIFWAGMSTTQRSEGINFFFDKYVNQKTTLKRFVEQYGNALRCKVEKETQADSRSLFNAVGCATDYPMEQQVQEVYTIAKFQEFQKELVGKMYCEVISKSEESIGTQFTLLADVVIGDWNVKKVSFGVFVSRDVSEVKCSCRMFEFRGILCRHALYALILINRNILLPDKYIFRRWRKDVRRSYSRVKVNYNGWVAAPGQSKYDSLMSTFTKFADLVALDENMYIEVMEYMKNGMEKVSKPSYMKISMEKVSNPSNHCGNNPLTQTSTHQNRSRNREPSVEILVSEDEFSDSEESEYEGENPDSSTQHILDPLVRKKKGRPRKLRLKQTYPKRKRQEKLRDSEKNDQDVPRQKKQRKSVQRKKKNTLNSDDLPSQTLDSNVVPTQESVHPSNLFSSQDIYDTSNLSCMGLLSNMVPQPTNPTYMVPQPTNQIYTGELYWTPQNQYFNYGGATMNPCSSPRETFDVGLNDNDELSR